ncbi:hypothetical protein AB0B50_00120 [Streptomyces sp. NPDC041068]
MSRGDDGKIDEVNGYDVAGEEVVSAAEPEPEPEPEPEEGEEGDGQS